MKFLFLLRGVVDRTNVLGVRVLFVCVCDKEGWILSPSQSDDSDTRYEQSGSVGGRGASLSMR